MQTNPSVSCKPKCGLPCLPSMSLHAMARSVNSVLVGYNDNVAMARSVNSVLVGYNDNVVRTAS